MGKCQSTRAAINAVMNSYLCANWQAPMHTEAREAFLDEALARRAEWEIDTLIDGWIWFRIGFMAARARYA